MTVIHTPADLATLLASWQLHLRGERKSPQTLKTYTLGVQLFLTWCTGNEVPEPLSRAAVNGWVASLLDQGAEPATARARQLAVRRFAAWLTDEGELDHDPLAGLKPPKLDAKVIPSLTDDELARLIKACDGRTFRDRRDEAIVRLMAECGLRSEELLSLTLADLNLTAGTVIIRRGKGFKGRTVNCGPRTGTAIDRYIRMRRTHRLATTDQVFLGDRGREFGYFALRRTLQYRAQLAGLEGFHPHVLRHTAAARWLDAGGSEGGLMSMAGWTRRDMLDRYVKSTSERRAIDEAKRLNLGDL